MKLNLRKIIKDETIADELSESIEKVISSSVKAGLQPDLPFEIAEHYQKNNGSFVVRLCFIILQYFLFHFKIRR